MQRPYCHSRCVELQGTLPGLVKAIACVGISWTMIAMALWWPASGVVLTQLGIGHPNCDSPARALELRGDFPWVCIRSRLVQQPPGL
eukprot:286709-Amphidinium_carterae.1